MLIPRYPLEPGVGACFYFSKKNLDFNQGQGRFQLIQWCILVVKRISQSKQRIKQIKGSSISSSSHSSKIEEAMEIIFSTSSSSTHHSKIEEVSKSKLANQHSSHNIQNPRSIQKKRKKKRPLSQNGKFHERKQK